MRILVLIALLAAQGAAPLPQESGTVTGQIRSTAGASVAGIRIAAMVAPAPGAAATEPATLERLTTTDNDGRFRLENVRPGSYYITAGFVDTPTYFPGVSRVADARAVVVMAGATLPGIDFGLAQSAGVKVTGRVKGAPDNLPVDYIHVALMPTGSTPRLVQMLDTVVSPDGTFEFQRVGPGTYSILTNPVLAFPQSNNRIELKDIDVGPLELAIGPVIVGQVSVDDGSPLPLPLVYAPVGNTIVNTPSLVGLAAILSTDPARTLSFGGVVRADGVFVVVNFQPGEYRITARMPFGYTIKSLTYRDSDLLKTTLKISDAASATGTVRLTLTKNPPPGDSGGVKVSGRVTGALPPTPSWISMRAGAPGSALAGAIGETPVRSDGTFEFQRVPPGAYSALLMPRQGTAPQVAIVVEDVDVANVEIPNIIPATVLTLRPPTAVTAPVVPGLPGTLAIQPPSYLPGVTVTGRVVMPTAANGAIPRTVVFFGPRDGLSVQGPIRGDGTFEIQNVPAGNYDARTLPLLIPPVSTRVVVGDKNVSGITLNGPAARNNP
jgi:hypothetical protein